ncbi:hypothetical protein OSTOST_22214 [Ostertagia ostertagi]
MTLQLPRLLGLLALAEASLRFKRHSPSSSLQHYFRDKAARQQHPRLGRQAYYTQPQQYYGYNTPAHYQQQYPQYPQYQHYQPQPYYRSSPQYQQYPYYQYSQPSYNGYSQYNYPSAYSGYSQPSRCCEQMENHPEQYLVRHVIHT